MLNGAISRRGFLGAAAASFLSGCLYSFVKELPRGAAGWPVFRFAHTGRLGLSFSGDPDVFRFCHDAAEIIRAMPDLDFTANAGGVTADSDPLSTMLAEEIRACTATRWYCSPTPDQRIRGFFEAPSPWSCSPVEGVQLLGLSPTDGETLDSAVPTLTKELEEKEGDFFIVLLHHPIRKPRGHPAEIPEAGVDTMRFILDAATDVKIVLSTGAAPPFVHKHAGLLHLCVPPPSEFPHVVAEATVVKHGISLRFHPLAPPWITDPEKEVLAASDEAEEHDPSDLRAYGKWLEGETGEKEHELR